MTLKTKPRNSLTPFILDVYDADQDERQPRVVARCDTRDGTIWRTSSGANVKPTMKQIREALSAA